MLSLFVHIMVHGLRQDMSHRCTVLMFDVWCPLSLQSWAVNMTACLPHENDNDFHDIK